MINKQFTIHKVILLLLFIVACLLFISEPLIAQEKPPQPTPYKLLAPIPQLLKPGSTNSTDTASYIPGLIRLVIGLAGALAVIRIIYGGFRYISSDAFGTKSNAKGIIEGAFWGLIMALSAWLVLYTVNPNLVKINLNIPVQKYLKDDSSSVLDGITLGLGNNAPRVVTNTGGITVSNEPLTQQQAMAQLQAAGIRMPSTPVLIKIQQAVINEVVNLKRSCGTSCDVAVTSGTAGRHNPGVCSHANGWKIDVDNTQSLNNFITNPANHYTLIVGPKTGAPVLREGKDKVYKAPSGALYAQESSHWDIVVPCK
ncbi:MAG: pilin [Patescibacteria group bacterium]